MNNMNQPLVSINIVTYNHGPYIAKAIGSILEQTFSDWELIIIDDGSTDDTNKILLPFLKDQRIHYEKNTSNQGVSEARNMALKKSSGEYIAVLDSDDIWINKDKLAKQVAYLEDHPRCALVGGNIIKINNEGRKLETIVFESEDQTIRKKILRQNQFAQSTVMYRKKAAADCGFYDATYKVCEDYNLWLAIGTKNQVANLPLLLAGYRIHDQNITRTKRLLVAKTTLAIVNKYHYHYPRHLLGWGKAYLRLLLTYLSF